MTSFISYFSGGLQCQTSNSTSGKYGYPLVIKHSYGKAPFLICKLSNYCKQAIIHSYVTNYQRVSFLLWLVACSPGRAGHLTLCLSSCFFLAELKPNRHLFLGIIMYPINYPYTSWLVVSNMNFIFHHIWDVILPIDSYFSEVSKPPDIRYPLVI